jgi:hypothetical protein
MKKTAMLLAVVFALSIGVFAQAKPDYSGEWTLDKSKSKLDERMSSSIESMTIKATQTATDIKVETETKRTPPPAGGGQGGGMPGGGQGGGGGRGMGGGSMGPMTYVLDGKETTIEVEGMGGNKMPVKLKANFESDGSLKLSSSRTFTTPNGDEIKTSTKETWILSDGGKTLTIKRESESPRGTQTNEFVLTKK